MPVNVLSPASPEASDLLRLWNERLWVCVFLLGVVTVSICWILIRYRRRDDHVPAQTTGNLRLEAIWTVVPILIVSALFVLSVTTARAVDKPNGGRDPDIVVNGHQWWWEVRYPAAHVITANEVHIPVGRDMLVGVGQRGPNLTDVANRLTEQQITLRILNGGYNMPAFASSLKPAEVRDLMAFLRTRSEQ